MTDAAALPRVGFIGLGAMGAGMARNLLAAGAPLTVLTSSPDKAHSFKGLGAEITDAPGPLAAATDVIVTCVPDAPALEALFTRADGFDGASLGGKLFIDCSTIAPHEAQALAARVEARGGRFIDAPISGGTKGANEGTLTIMCGGDGADFDAARRVLGAMGRSITLFGPVGAGQAVKAANQLMVAVNMMGAFEAIAIARAHGVDPHEMREALLTGAARSGVLEMHALRYLDDALAGGFRIELLLKDLGLVSAVGRSAGLAQPAATLAQQLVQAACNAGLTGQDSAVLGKLYDSLNGRDDRA